MPKKILITYTNHLFYDCSKDFIKSAKKFNDFDEYITFYPWDIDEEFRKKNFDILREHKGAGYWLWKPYIIKKTLARMQEGDVLIYMDAGTCFTRSIQPALDIFNSLSLPIMVFGIDYIEKDWVKRDLINVMELDKPEYMDTRQRCAGYSIWRKNAISERICDEWLSYAQVPQLITDSPSIAPNYPSFVEHRHDQAIFSLLTKKYDLPAFRLISQHGNKDMQYYKNSPYPQMIMKDARINNSNQQLFYRLLLREKIITKYYRFYKDNYGYLIIPPIHKLIQSKCLHWLKKIYNLKP